MRAFVESCLHRGTQLRTDAGSVKQFKCPFHGWTWNLDGALTELPGAWNFPQVDRAKACLPQAKVGLWAGFVFINFDPGCEPLEAYLEILPHHFQEFALEDHYKAAHVAKSMPCNLKLAMEAFIESYHVPQAHPQVLGYYGTSMRPWTPTWLSNALKSFRPNKHPGRSPRSGISDADD